MSKQIELNLEERRQDWVARGGALMEQIADWSKANGWKVSHHEQQLQEQLLGTYSLPSLQMGVKNGVGSHSFKLDHGKNDSRPL